MTNNLIHRSTYNEPLFLRTVTAQLAQVSVEFLVQCEQEGLIEYRVISGGSSGFYTSDIRRLARIRRLRDDLELDFPAVEVVLNLRQQLLDLMDHTETLEQQMIERERQLLSEIQLLRSQLAEKRQW